MTCCGQPNTCERPCFHGGPSSYIVPAEELAGVNIGFTLSKLEPPRILERFTLVDPVIRYTQPEPRKLTLHEQCEAAMARLKAHVYHRCAEHREAIRANSNWAIDRMHQRHDAMRARHDLERWGLPAIRVDRLGFISGFGLAGPDILGNMGMR